MQTGSVVISKSGSDEGKTYVVVGFAQNGYALVSDGARHKIESPKKKNVRHLLDTNDVIDVPKTDALLVTAIRRFKP